MGINQAQLNKQSAKRIAQGDDLGFLSKLLLYTSKIIIARNVGMVIVLFHTI
jgi:hypothetical protein